jgi:hypothetical protein
MKTTMFLFVKRQYGFQFVSGGFAVIAKPEDGVYLTVTCEDESTPPAAGTMTAEQMAG